MKEQKSLSDTGLKRAFEDALVHSRDDLSTNGTAQMLRMLSESVQRLQEQGVDISLTVIANGHSNAYDMIYTTSGTPSKGETEIGAYGIIHSGESAHLFALNTGYAGKPVQRIYVSKFNTNFEGGRVASSSGGNQNARIAANIYDFNEDENALQKLQLKLAYIAAENVVILEYDTGGVFNRQNALPHKPGNRLKF